MHFFNTQLEQDDHLELLDAENNYYKGKLISFDQDEGALIIDVHGVPQVIERKKILRMYGGRERSIWFLDPPNTLEACSTIETTHTSKFKPGELLTFMDSNNQQVIAKISKIDSKSITADIINKLEEFEILGPLNIMSDEFFLKTDVSTSADAKSVKFQLAERSGGAGAGVHAAIHAHMQSNPGWSLTNRK